MVIFKSNFPHFYWCKKQHERSEAQEKGLRQINGGKVNGCNNKRTHRTLLSYQKRKWMADVLYYFKGKKLQMFPNLEHQFPTKVKHWVTLCHCLCLVSHSQPLVLFFSLNHFMDLSYDSAVLQNQDSLLNSHRICFGIRAGNKDHIS